MAILRINGVLAVTGQRSKTPIYQAARDGLFTKPVAIGGQRARGWPDYEVEALTAARVAGLPDDAIRALVVKLHAQRAERFSALTQAPTAPPASVADASMQAMQP